MVLQGLGRGEGRVQKATVAEEQAEQSIGGAISLLFVLEPEEAPLVIGFLIVGGTFSVAKMNWEKNNKNKIILKRGIDMSPALLGPSPKKKKHKKKKASNEKSAQVFKEWNTSFDPVKNKEKISRAELLKERKKYETQIENCQKFISRYKNIIAQIDKELKGR